MSAQLLQFPSKALPPHWSARDVYMFEHHRDNGLGVEAATDAVEQMHHVMREVPGEADPLLRQAREAFALMARMQQ